MLKSHRNDPCKIVGSPLDLKIKLTLYVCVKQVSTLSRLQDLVLWTSPALQNFSCSTFWAGHLMAPHGKAGQHMQGVENCRLFAKRSNLFESFAQPKLSYNFCSFTSLFRRQMKL